MLSTPPDGWAIQRPTEMSRFKTFLPKTLYEGGLEVAWLANSPCLVTHTKSRALLRYTLKLILFSVPEVPFASGKLFRLWGHCVPAESPGQTAGRWEGWGLGQVFPASDASAGDRQYLLSISPGKGRQIMKCVSHVLCGVHFQHVTFG